MDYSSVTDNSEAMYIGNDKDYEMKGMLEIKDYREIKAG